MPNAVSSQDPVARVAPAQYLREPVRWDAGGVVGALHQSIEHGLRLDGADLKPAEWFPESLITAVSRAAGPIALALAYTTIALLFFG